MKIEPFCYCIASYMNLLIIAKLKSLPTSPAILCISMDTVAPKYSVYRCAVLCYTYLQEPADSLFVLRFHGDNILKEPEEGPVLTRGWMSVREDAEELKEQPTSPLCVCVCVGGGGGGG